MTSDDAVKENDMGFSSSLFLFWLARNNTMLWYKVSCLIVGRVLGSWILAWLVYALGKIYADKSTLCHGWFNRNLLMRTPQSQVLSFKVLFEG